MRVHSGFAWLLQPGPCQNVRNTISSQWPSAKHKKSPSFRNWKAVKCVLLERLSVVDPALRWQDRRVPLELGKQTNLKHRRNLVQAYGDDACFARGRFRLCA